MDVIIFQAIRRHGEPDDGCTFEVSTDGGATFVKAQKAADGKPFASVPSIAALPMIVVRATPTDTKFWGGTGSFRWQTEAGLVRADAPSELFFIHGTVKSGADSVTVIYFHLGAFRDVSAPMLEKLNDVPKEFDRKWFEDNEGFPSKSWLKPPPAFYGIISHEVVAGPNVTFVPNIAPASVEVTLLERRGPNVRPQLFAVAWPTSMRRDLDTSATSFLVFFTHQLNQNLGPLSFLDQYPDSWGYLHLAIYQYLNYHYNPLDTDSFGHSWRGLCYQLSASQKQAVLVLPLGDAKNPEAEVGDCLDAAKLEELLLEIQAFFLKRAGLIRPPSTKLGRVAMASFSSGNNQTLFFLNRQGNHAHRFYLDTLREVYSLDIPREFAIGWAGLAQRWASVGKDADQKVIRMYGTHPPAYEPIHRALLGTRAPAAPYTSSSSDGLRTVTVLPEASWRNAIGKPDVDPRTLGGPVHELCCATLLTDALRRSPGF